MNQFRGASVAGVLFATAVGVGGTQIASASQVGGLRVGAPQGSLNSVAVFGPHLAWAIGTRPHGHGVASLVERWDGKSWTPVAVPDEPGHDAGFGSIAGSSANDVWAFGSYEQDTREVSFADHWDGSAWSKVAIPYPHATPFGALVQGLSVVSPTDAWASGLAGLRRPWVLHWDGTSWTRVPCPNFGGPAGTQAWGISAFSATDAWITGVVSTLKGSSRTMAAHWDGTTWTRVDTPNVPGVESVPWNMDASSPDNIWAAGYTNDPDTGSGGPFMMHWDGTAWTLAHLPHTGRYSSFYTVSTASSEDAWAVGADGPRALAMHWDGTTWTIASPSRPAQDLIGVDDYSTQLAIAVGSSTDGTALHEIWNGRSWHSM